MSQESTSTLDARIAARDAVLKEQEEARLKALQLETELAKTFRPSKDRIVVRKSSKSETASGILLPETRKERPTTGTIIAVGPEVKEFRVGDIVLYMEYAGVDIQTVEGTNLSAHFVCTEDELFGKFERAGT